MGYQPLARKCRPQTFDEVIAQNHITQTLKNAILSEKMTHCFLFAGPRGVGKTSVARIFAKSINCKDGPTGTPCNQCSNCIEITKGYSIDILEIDGASNTGVDNIRELRENVQYLPAKTRYKVYIIDEVHMLSNSAFNALLKTLEEPPNHVIFILATTDPHKIPETIISRCQRFHFKRIPYALICEKLAEIVQESEITVEESSLHIIARAAQGSLRDAQVLLDQVIAYCSNEIHYTDVLEILDIVDRQIYLDLTDAILKRDGRRCIEILESAYNQGFPVREFYRGLLEHFRDVAVLSISQDTSDLLHLPDNELRLLEKQAQSVQYEDIKIYMEKIISKESEIYHSSSPKIILEAIIFDMVAYKSISSFTHLVEKLTALEKRILNLLSNQPEHHALDKFSEPVCERTT
ncbi:MAG: DNA polymerase III subunit gamma/tau, partial [Thermodesulfobacteriota bacterium]|nr:DNA polymerase III subunit gamma/tau [Thermodesulfobacteriota bacterium]